MAERHSTKRDRSEFEREPVTRADVQKLSDQMDKTSLRSSLRSPARKRRAAGHKTVPGAMNIEKTGKKLARRNRLPLPVDITTPVPENGGCNSTSRGLQRSSDTLDGDDDKAGTLINGAVTINQRSGDRPLPKPISIAVVHPTTGGKSLLSFAAPSTSIASDTEDEDEEAETSQAEENDEFVKTENQVEVAHDREVSQGRGKKWSLAHLHHNYESDVVYVTEELLSEDIGEEDDADIIYHQEPGMNSINQARANKLIGAYEGYYLLSKAETGWSREEERRRAETHIKVAAETNTSMLYPEDAGTDSLEQKLIWVQSHIDFTKENPDSVAIKAAHQEAGSPYAFTHLLPSWYPTHNGHSTSASLPPKGDQNMKKKATIQCVEDLSSKQTDSSVRKTVAKGTTEKSRESLPEKCRKVLEIMMKDVEAGRYEPRNSPEANLTYEGDFERDAELFKGNYPGTDDECFDVAPPKAYLPVHTKYGYWLVTLVAAGYSVKQLVWLCGPINEVPGSKTKEGYTKQSLSSRLSMRVSRTCNRYTKLLETTNNGSEGPSAGVVGVKAATPKIVKDKQKAGVSNAAARPQSIGGRHGASGPKGIKKAKKHKVSHVHE